MSSPGPPSPSQPFCLGPRPILTLRRRPRLSARRRSLPRRPKSHGTSSPSRRREAIVALMRIPFAPSPPSTPPPPEPSRTRKPLPPREEKPVSRLSAVAVEGSLAVAAPAVVCARRGGSEAGPLSAQEPKPALFPSEPHEPEPAFFPSRCPSQPAKLRAAWTRPEPSHVGPPSRPVLVFSPGMQPPFPFSFSV